MDSQRKTHPFTTSDFIYTEAIDTYKIPNKIRHTISLPENKRNQFFASHPRISALLKRERYNPLLEEGKKQGYERDRNGEYYLTREALTVLIRHAKMKYRNKPDINLKNIFIFDKSDANSLLRLSKNIKLQPGEDAKLIFFHELHAFMIYIRNENEQIKVFVIDSEPNSLLDVAAISKFFLGKIFLVLNTTPLQKDFSSCVTFTYKALLYFMKHGAEVFPYLENKVGKNPGCYALNSTELMPNLLKMSQSTLNLPDSVLDTVVSKKNGETLRQYWERNQSNFDGKKFNVAAIAKKYKYLAEIENYLAEQEISEQAISQQKINILPRLFGEAKDELLGIDMPEREMIIDVCIKIANGIDDYETQSLKKFLTEKMPQFISSLEHFAVNDKAEQDSSYLHKILYIAAIAECFVNLPITKSEEHISKSQGYAKKLLRLFGNSQQALSYLKKFWTITDPEPLNHLCSFELPLNDEGWNKTFWSSLLMHYGKKANLYLSIAKELEPKMQNKSILDKNIFIILQSLAKDIAYPRGNEFPELANICIQYRKSNQIFEDCLFSYKIGWIKKGGDLLPDLDAYFYKTTNNQMIECKTEKSHKKPDYTFKKIPFDSLKPLFLGEETKCCQSIDGAGRSVVMEGMSSSHSAFYIVLDKKIASLFNHGDGLMKENFVLIRSNMLMLDSEIYYP